MKNEFTFKTVGKNEKINLLHHNKPVQMKPTEVYLQQDGATDGGSSLCIVLERDGFPTVFGQISVKMFQPVLDGLKK